LVPIHPGQILLEEFMEPLNLSQNRLAKALGVTPKTINDIVTRKRGITGNIALRLSRYFGTTPGFWMNLQKRYELETAEDKYEAEIAKIGACPREVCAAPA
jgi:antitoxin HigA-1